MVRFDREVDDSSLALCNFDLKESIVIHSVVRDEPCLFLLVRPSYPFSLRIACMHGF